MSDNRNKSQSSSNSGGQGSNSSSSAQSSNRSQSGSHPADSRVERSEGKTVTNNSDGSSHTTTYVNTSAGDLHASYDTDKDGNFSNAHFTGNDRGRKKN